MLAASRTNQSKTVPLIYGGISAVLLLVIAALALVFVPPSPPSVAEFAPQAQEALEQALEQQSSQFGSGTGGACALGQICDDETSSQLSPTKRTVIEKGRVRRCVGDPPRQIEDPQSPPCVAFWAGENGGATWKGVTRDEIRVAYFNDGQPYDLLFNFFNRRFEFYGRKIRPVPIPASQSRPLKPEEQRAMAQRVAQEEKAFASVGYFRGESQFYFRELARLGVMAIQDLTLYETSSELRQFSPYWWTYRPPLDQVLHSDVEFACNSLVGKRAEYAGAPTNAMTRSFAVGVDGDGSNPDYRPLVDGLRRCGAPVRVIDLPRSVFGLSTGGQFKTIAADMQSSGITSVFCVCEEFQWFNLGFDADQIGYQPEWISTGMSEISDYFNSPGAGASKNSWFGLGTDAKDQALPNLPVYWALKESDPAWSGDPTRIGKWYGAMLLFASGIQQAGPNLTPQTFAKGLADTNFSNPSSGAAPFWQARVGFGAADHSMVDDLHMFWYSPEASREQSKSNDPPGTVCYVNRGERWSVGNWPKGSAALFDRTKPCR